MQPFLLLPPLWRNCVVNQTTYDFRMYAKMVL